MNDVLDTIHEALEYYLTVWGARSIRGSGYEYPPYEEHKARIDAALAWLDAQAANGREDKSKRRKGTR